MFQLKIFDYKMIYGIKKYFLIQLKMVISAITTNIYICNYYDADNTDQLIALGITHIINLSQIRKVVDSSLPITIYNYQRYRKYYGNSL